MMFMLLLLLLVFMHGLGEPMSKVQDFYQEMTEKVRMLHNNPSLNRLERFSRLALVGYEIQQRNMDGSTPVEHRELAIRAYELALAALSLDIGDSIAPSLVQDVRLVRSNLGDLYLKTGKPDLAIEIYTKQVNHLRKGDDDNKHLASVLYSRSNALSLLGHKRDAANDLLEAILLNPPGSPHMMNSFALMGKNAFAMQDVTDKTYDDFVKMFQAEADRRFASFQYDQSSIDAMRYFALFNIFNDELLALKPEEQQEESDAVVEKAWYYLLIGTKIMRQQLLPDLRQAKQQHELLQSIFTKGLMDWCRGMGFGYHDPEGSRVIFVVGLPRSGSTLVEQILQAHSKVTGLGEESDFTFFLHQFHSVLIQATRVDGQFDADGVKTWINTNAPLVFAKMKARHENLARKNIIFVDKMLFHYLHVGMIYMTLPNSKIVHVYKSDHEKAKFSLFRRQFQGSTANWSYNWRDMDQYFRYYTDLITHWRDSVPSEFFMDLEYEKLVQDFEGTSKKLLAFCNLKWEDGVLQFYNKKKVILTTSATQVAQPIYETGQNVWTFYKDLIEKQRLVVPPPAAINFIKDEL